jgi:hypothetical protein
MPRAPPVVTASTGSNDAADSMVGTALAAAKNAPLLFTTGATLPSATEAETFGGTSAVDESIQSQIDAGPDKLAGRSLG